MPELDSAIREFSLAVVKTSFDTNNPDPNHRMCFRLSSSDTGKDLSGEAMSMELFRSFVDKIENGVEIPEQFKSVICEGDWCGGMPYISIAHYKSGSKAKNVPGALESVYIDGDILKSKGYLYNTPLGRATFDSLLEDMSKKKSGTMENDYLPVRVSIGFLDLQHKHNYEGGQEFIFTRSNLTDKCSLCEQGIGGKIYLDGILVHEAFTRKPMNPRTSAELEEKSMDDEILTRKDDARSIIGDLADTLDIDIEQKSALVIKSDGATETEFNLDDVVKSKLSEIQANPVKPVTEGEVVESVMKLYDLHRKSDVVEEKMDKEHKEEMKDEMKEEEKKEEKSTLDTAFDTLKSVLANKGTKDEVQAAYNGIAMEVEKAYTPKEIEQPVGDIAEIVKSAVEAALTPLRTEVATLRAQIVTQKSQTDVPQPRSLKLTPQNLIQKSQPVQKRTLTQLEKIARKSVYGGMGMEDPEQVQ